MRTEENMWGLRANFYSSMYPETTQDLINERPPGSRHSIDGIKLVPLT